MGAALNGAQVDEIVRFTRARVEEYSKNETISLENRDEKTLFCVKSGLIYLCAENEEYEKSILRVFRPGEFFSEDMVLNLTHGVSYLIAKYKSQVIGVGRAEMERLCKTQSDWSERIERLFVRQLPESMMAQNYILHQKSLRMKLIYYFKHECAVQGTTELTLPMPFSDLADYLNADRSAMMKEITRMKQEGLLLGTRRNVIFRDPSD